MQRFYRVVYRVEKNDDPGTAVERIENAIAQSSSPQHRLMFLFVDPLLGKQKSALDSLVKNYPVFESYRTTMNLSPTAEIPAISGEGVARETLIEVARGIPRRFPFGTATFAWRDVAALDFAPDSAPVDSTAGGLHGRIAGRTGMPGITLVSKWGSPKRTLDLTAVVRLNAQIGDGKKPQLPEATQILLDAIGRRKTGDVFALPEVAEAADAKETATRVDDAFKLARAALLGRMSQLSLEPLETRAPGAGAPENPGSVKEPLSEVLAPLGYAPLRGAAGPGLIVFAKRTPEGHELRISVDRGTWSHHFAGRFEIRTERWARAMSIPLASGDFPGQTYPLLDERQIHRLCKNLATAVYEIEKIVYTAVRDAF